MRFNGILAGGLVASWCAVAALAAAPPTPPKRAPKKAAVKKAAPQVVAPAEVARPPAAPAAGPAISPAEAEFFETQVRPVLAEKCYSCHGPKLQQAGLRVDSRAALLRGTDAGQPSLVPGDPEKSSLVTAIRHTGAVKMPPQGKLPDKDIQALTEWVKMGAPWPGGGAVVSTESAADRAKKHWAFQPVRKPAVPAVKNKTWIKSPVDAFILAKLEKKGIAPSRIADRRTLIRRATFDLTGLPPTMEEIEAFIQDKSPTAFATVVDRLLASPRYGERWARYWLDIARYADTKGYVFQEERRYPYAYTYRDYVIRAFNEDLPYDQFLTHQIAADHLPLGDDKRPLAAMGFLTLGRRFLNNQADIIDDRIDTVMRGTQGMTVACARCHDHKFDPIPTKDYYSLYGVFASSVEPADLPLISVPERTEAYLAYEKQLQALQANVDQFLAGKHAEYVAGLRSQVGDYLLAAHDAKNGMDVQRLARNRDLSPMVLRRWQEFLAETRKSQHPVFAAWNAYAAVPEAEFAAKAPAVIASLAPSGSNALVAQSFSMKPPATLKEAAQRYGQLLADIDRRWKQAQAEAAKTGAAAPGSLPNGNEEQLRQVLYAQNSPVNVPLAEARQLFNRADRDRLQGLQQRVDGLKATSPGAPARAMALADAPTPVTPRVFRRGNPGNPGEEVPRQFLAVLSGPERKPFTKGSGRLELAQAIASKENPLTARVMMNRIWLNHFGAGLVRTPSDFGLRSDPPTHPELLDYLATRFMEEGWSVKKMHRLIMLSSTYQQASDVNPRSAQIDPENMLVWRMNRRRLDFEATRDSLLAASGQLDLKMGGPSVELGKPEANVRRAVYLFVDRQNLPGLFRTFDFASPDSSSPMRFNTTVPQQALFLMNSPFVVEQARQLIQRPEVAGETQAAQKIQRLYRLVYGRDAEPDEVALGLRFLKSVQAPAADTAARPSLWQYGYGEVDEATKRLKGFTRLPHFTGTAWQGGPQLPDPKTGWATLNAAGGHAGNDLRHAVIRRWTAPRDGSVGVGGTLSHGVDMGDGVRGRIISSRQGVLGTWVARNGKVETPVARVEVKQGDTLDFVVDCQAEPSHDSFAWVPVVKSLNASEEWNAASGFSGPATAAQPLAPWAKYAQALLLSNEFFFVD